MRKHRTTVRNCAPENLEVPGSRSARPGTTTRPRFRQAGNRASGTQRVHQQARHGHLANAAGHRRDRARDLQCFGKRNIADKPRLAAIRRRQPVDADIDHGCARLDPVAAHHFGLADRGIDQVGARGQVRQIARARMRDRHRGVFVEQQLHQRPADQVRAADHDRIHALERGMHALGQDDAAERRAGRQRGKAAGQPPGIVRMQPVDILGGIDGVDDGFGIN